LGERRAPFGFLSFWPVWAFWLLVVLICRDRSEDEEEMLDGSLETERTKPTAMGASSGRL
jgi:hypothetical protein